MPAQVKLLRGHARSVLQLTKRFALKDSDPKGTAVNFPIFNLEYEFSKSDYHELALSAAVQLSRKDNGDICFTAGGALNGKFVGIPFEYGGTPGAITDVTFEARRLATPPKEAPKKSWSMGLNWKVLGVIISSVGDKQADAAYLDWREGIKAGLKAGPKAGDSGTISGPSIAGIWNAFSEKEKVSLVHNLYARSFLVSLRWAPSGGYSGTLIPEWRPEYPSCILPTLVSLPIFAFLPIVHG